MLAGADAHAGQALIGAAAGHAQQVIPVFLLQIALGEHVRGLGVQGAQVAGVAGIAAAHGFGRMLGDDDVGAGPRRGDGGG